MSPFLIILNAIIPIFLIILAGFTIRKTKWIADVGDIHKIALYLLFPCLVLHSIIGNKALTNIGTIFFAAGLGFLSVTIGMLIARLFARLIGAKTPAALRTFALSAGCQNDSYIPIPLAVALFDRDTVGLIFLFGFGWDLAFWTVGMVVLAGNIKKDTLRHFANPGLISIFAALLLNAFGAESWMPASIANTLDWLGACCIPLILLLTGITMADYSKEFRFQYAMRVVSAAVLVRIIVMGGILLVAAAFLPMPAGLRNVMILQSAMPAAIFPIIAIKNYGGDPLVAIKVVFGTSLVALFTAPFLIDFAIRHIP